MMALFLSTLSLRRATTPRLSRVVPTPIFLSTLSLRRATRQAPPRFPMTRFLSTLSLRRATPGLLTPLLGRRYFYPRSPCGERRVLWLAALRPFSISIHALLAESDITTATHTTAASKFLSTLSLRRATAKVHKTVGYFCAYEINFMEITSSC